MASAGVVALLILGLVAVFVNASLSRDQCTSTRYCPDGYRCCSDTYHCCPVGYRCCFGDTKCCLNLSLNSTVASRSGGSSEINDVSENEEVVVHDQRDYQQILQRVFPGFRAGGRREVMDRPLGDNPVIIVYN
ncbi:hypothetical protein GE061_010297 [Apolygus lucorum]|uniref:Granulins domain-containing protein n=1 Tax=Apolygus lucorum TaxID=248454 RepID=A0A8S9Y4P0_APOLU|nr:hypothetical protein GE061_010297 [Apolygus lucorum]